MDSSGETPSRPGTRRQRRPSSSPSWNNPSPSPSPSASPAYNNTTNNTPSSPFLYIKPEPWGAQQRSHLSSPNHHHHHHHHHHPQCSSINQSSNSNSNKWTLPLSPMSPGLGRVLRGGSPLPPPTPTSSLMVQKKKDALMGRDKESLVEEIMEIKKSLLAQSLHCQRHKVQVTNVQSENRRLEKDIEELEVQGKAMASRTGNPTRLRAKLQGLKMKVADLQATCDTQRQELSVLQRDIRITHTREVETERDVFAEEITRLQRYVKRLKNFENRILCENKQLHHLQDRTNILEATNHRLQDSLHATEKCLEKMKKETEKQKQRANENCSRAKRKSQKCHEVLEHASLLTRLLEKERTEKIGFSNRLSAAQEELRKLEAHILHSKPNPNSDPTSNPNQLISQVFCKLWELLHGYPNPKPSHSNPKTASHHRHTRKHHHHHQQQHQDTVSQSPSIIVPAFYDACNIASVGETPLQKDMKNVDKPEHSLHSEGNLHAHESLQSSESKENLHTKKKIGPIIRKLDLEKIKAKAMADSGNYSNNITVDSRDSNSDSESDSNSGSGSLGNHSHAASEASRSKNNKPDQSSYDLLQPSQKSRELHEESAAALANYYQESEAKPTREGKSLAEEEKTQVRNKPERSTSSSSSPLSSSSPSSSSSRNNSKAARGNEMVISSSISSLSDEAKAKDAARSSYRRSEQVDEDPQYYHPHYQDQ